MSGLRQKADTQQDFYKKNSYAGESEDIFYFLIFLQCCLQLSSLFIEHLIEYLPSLASSLLLFPFFFFFNFSVLPNLCLTNGH